MRCRAPTVCRLVEIEWADPTVWKEVTWATRITVIIVFVHHACEVVSVFGEQSTYLETGKRAAVSGGAPRIFRQGLKFRV